MATLTSTQVLDAGLDDWRLLLGTLRARFRTGDFLSGVRLVQAVAEAAEAANHHPDVTLTYPHVDLTLVSHDVGGLTERDVAMARQISEIARGQGVAADPRAATVLEVALDTAAPDAVAPFWAAVLTGDPDAAEDDEVTDPQGRVPTMWFQRSEPRREGDGAQRFHLDVWVAPDEAQTRIDAAVAAGGVVVDAEQAPSFTVLADADGNKACICTALDRA